MTQINWDLLGPPVDIGGRFNQGMQQGRAIRIQATRDSALSALGQDPSNEQALSALAGVDPQTAYQFQEAARRRAEGARQSALQAGLTGAYDPATGRIDPVRARQAYVGAGDVEGAMQFDASRASQQNRITEAQREAIKFGARILEGVDTPEKYTAARAAYARAGFDLSGVPEAFDPAYVQQVIQAGTALSTPERGNAPNIQREVEYYESIGRRDLAEQLLERHAEGPPIITDNGDGTRTITPRSAISGGSTRPRTAPRQDEASLRAAAAEAIRRGADPSQVNARLEQMLKGGGSPATGTGTFQP